MDVPYAQPVPDSLSANPYAEVPIDASLPVQNLIGVEGDTVICRQDFDLRRFCYFSGKEQSTTITDLPFRTAPVMPDWFSPVHNVLLVVLTVAVMLLALFVDMRLAGVVAFARFFEIGAILTYLWLTCSKLRLRAASSAGIRERIRQLGWGYAFLFLVWPAAFANAALACWFFSGRPLAVGIHAQSIAYCVLVLIAAVAEYYLPMVLVRRHETAGVYRIDGLSPKLVDALRSYCDQ